MPKSENTRRRTEALAAQRGFLINRGLARPGLPILLAGSRVPVFLNLRPPRSLACGMQSHLPLGLCLLSRLSGQVARSRSAADQEGFREFGGLAVGCVDTRVAETRPPASWDMGFGVSPQTQSWPGSLLKSSDSWCLLRQQLSLSCFSSLCFAVSNWLFSRQGMH